MMVISLSRVCSSVYSFERNEIRETKAIRWRIYCGWAHELRKKEVGPEGTQYRFPASVLKYLRSIAKKDIKGEIRKDAFDVSMEAFCKYIIGK